MPSLPPKQCSSALCREYTTTSGRCDKHQRKPWASNEGKTSTQRGYGAAWRKVRATALKRDKHLCQVCLKQGRYIEGREVDHIINKAQGGTDNLTNLQTICTPCHKAKTTEERNM